MAQRQPTADERNAIIDSLLGNGGRQVHGGQRRLHQSGRAQAHRQARNETISAKPTTRTAGSRDHHHHVGAGATVDECRAI